MKKLRKDIPQSIINVLAGCGFPEALKKTRAAEPQRLETWADSFRFAPKVLQVKAAQLACELLLPGQTDDAYNRPQKVLEAVKAWLENPDEETLDSCRERTDAVETIWNSWADDTNGATQNVYQAAFYLGKTVCEDMSWNVAHCLNAVTGEVGETARSQTNEAIISWILNNREMLAEALATNRYELPQPGLLPVTESELARLKKLLNVQDATTTAVLTALLQNIHKHYPEPAKESFYEPNAIIHAKIPMAIGANPIMLTQVYEKPDHACYVTFFLGPLIGYEMSFRVAKAAEPAQPQYLSLAQLKAQKEKAPVKKDFLNLLINLTNNTLFKKEYYDDAPFHVKYMPDWFGNSIKALVFMKDPVLREVFTPVGDVKYIQAVGITQEEYDQYFDPEKHGQPKDNKAGSRYLGTRYSTDSFLITVDA